MPDCVEMRFHAGESFFLSPLSFQSRPRKTPADPLRTGARECRRQQRVERSHLWKALLNLLSPSRHLASFPLSLLYCLNTMTSREPAYSPAALCVDKEEMHSYTWSGKTEQAFREFGRMHRLGSILKRKMITLLFRNCDQGSAAFATVA